MRTRAFRRHQLTRARARAARYWVWLFAGSPELVTPRRLARRAVDRTPCSCWMCGHRRRWHGPTWQERRADAVHPGE